MHGTIVIFNRDVYLESCSFVSDIVEMFVNQELTRREVEYMALSRDTTESDLKQRREIRAGTAFYIDQVATKDMQIMSLT